MRFDIRFEGFYQSIHAGIIETMIDGHFLDDSGNPEEIPDNLSYKKIYTEYAKKYAEEFFEYIEETFELEIPHIFEKLYSPREYNFETDSIFVEISEDSFNELKEYFLGDMSFVAFVNEKSKSRSGFVSFYEGIDKVKEEDSILLAYIGMYIIDQDTEDEIVDKVSEATCNLLNEIDFQS